jgi:predicted DCC family thiol-disulfide oxidoreductase YuxK
MTTGDIVYDPDCGFCRVCVAVVLSWDRQGRLRPVALGTEEADTMLAGMPEAAQMASWHLVRDTVFSGGAAFSPLFRLLPGGGPLGRIAQRFPGAADRGYRWVAGHRSLFGRLLPDAVKRWADRVISESEPRSR